MRTISTPYYKTLDLFAIIFAAVLAYWLRFGEFRLATDYILPTTIYALSASYSLAISGFYGDTNSGLSSRKLTAVISAIAIAVLITTTMMYLTKTGQSFSRIWFIGTVAISLSAILSSRLILARMFSTSLGRQAIVIIGGNQTAIKAEEKLSSQAAANQGITLLRRFDVLKESDPKDAIRKSVDFIREHSSHSKRSIPVSEVWLTADVFSNQPIAEFELLISDVSATVVYIPEMPLLAGFDIRKVDSVMGVPTLNSGHRKSRKVNIFFKYLEDKVGATILLLAALPVMTIIAILIKLDSKGPTLFTQPRHGFAGKKFNVFKFRTMYFSGGNEVFRQAVTDDARITKFGKWLRRTSLDELPQLINVLNGTMSLVGPRPHPVELNHDFRHKIDQYMARHSVKPGITGLAQVNGYRGETSTQEMMENRIKCDLDYVQNWSVLLDIKILFATIKHILVTDKAV
ncbi:exopolysaccharide biosynthesis polyprenyl glycosylphosphotransferase [Arenicella xantha]|uniref:Putative colanic acid biosynthesis UDP-glucose lipid carrier transferase n=1 Tax=Arenicella xantha TaxID=644221 RepID=A0A395JIK5_9GAMM|nr:exopolysaccharide biosynthesis polyprenyl glycosylphosphotransferase [Arenicella xantha]RBP49896.1 putative colanic acid biosynthesis UDP-glucose lipid carrier transferase [Arenicella xantha]